MQLRFLLSGMLALLLSSLSLAAEKQNYSAVGPNVSFGAVQSLPYRDSDRRVAYGEDALQFGRLWLPTANDRRVTLIFIHGGCWLNEYDMTHTYAFATALADAGYTVWSLEYRRTGDAGGGWPGTFEDIQSGIDFITQLGADVETASVGLLGHSAGGHLALLAGARDDTLAIDLDLVVGLAAITDVTRYAAGSNSCEIATPAFMGGTPQQNAAAYRDANPASFGVHSNSVLLWGDADAIVAPDQAELAGARSILSPGAGHFDWVHPGTPAFSRLLELLDAAF